MDSSPNPPKSLRKTAMDSGSNPNPEGVEGSLAAVLPDDLVAEILARLPARSLCRFKCVSRAWRAVISDPAHRARFAQPMAGIFFSRAYGGRPSWGFAGVSSPLPWVDTALSFLPHSCGEMELLDSCNGLLLLRCWSPQPPFYVVCNPATSEWIALPQPSHAPGQYGYNAQLREGINTCQAALGFDPAVSSHFHVFQLVQKENYYHFEVAAVEIFSSETGRWVLRESGWGDRECILFPDPLTYFNGFLFFPIIGNAVASVDTKGQTWKVSLVRNHKVNDYGCLFLSQGRLLYVVYSGSQKGILSIYALEDHDSGEWSFKQSVNMLDLFGPRTSQQGWECCVAAIHPHGDLIFFYDWSQKRLMSYNMNHGDLRVVCTIGEAINEYPMFLSYVPLYSGALALPNVN
ncbi:hypothetical protein ACP70R_019979 [Stipagrostis hirtigluma subsp. patula]